MITINYMQNISISHFLMVRYMSISKYFSMSKMHFASPVIHQFAMRSTTHHVISDHVVFYGIHTQVRYNDYVALLEPPIAPVCSGH